MVVLRCTKKLLGRLPPRLGGEGDTRGSDTRLGDWTANLFSIGRQQIVLGVNNKTLLPVLLPIAPSKTFLPRFVEAAGEMLMAIGVTNRMAVLVEMAAMGDCIVAPTNDRRVLGTINDFGRALDFLMDLPLPEIALRLAGTPCSPIGMEYPKDVARGLFAQVGSGTTRPPLRLVKG